MSVIQKRSAGLLVPLFSLRRESDWGIGEFRDAGAIAPWMNQAGLSLLMVLPLLEVALGQRSPYSCLSAFALDPIYLSLEEIEDFAELGGEESLDEDDRARLERLRNAPRVDYDAVRALKERQLRRCWERFASAAGTGSDRARDLARFREEHVSWLSDYALFRALKGAHPSSWWPHWEPALLGRAPEALAQARAAHASEIAYFEYLQWLAFGQLERARGEAHAHEVRLAGDLPFTVAEDSADAWALQSDLGLDASVGAPPDAYSKDGQDWGLPIYRWDAIAQNRYRWLRERGAVTAKGFDLVRVDHVVGFYRTYVRPKDGRAPFFSPAEEPAQLANGEAAMQALASGGTALIAEDLGTVPRFVRRSLVSLGIPGFRVLRWEREEDETRFIDPETWPALSVATTGTHDTEPLAVWYDELPVRDRDALLGLPQLARLRGEDALAFGGAAHAALLETVYGSGSNLLVLPVQDLFGERERINLPGTVGPSNWTYRMPFSLHELATAPRAREATRRLRALAVRHARAAGEAMLAEAPALDAILPAS